MDDEFLMNFDEFGVDEFLMNFTKHKQTAPNDKFIGKSW